MEDAGVVPGLVLADARFLFHERDAGAGRGAQQLQCAREPDDAAADHQYRSFRHLRAPVASVVNHPALRIMTPPTDALAATLAPAGRARIHMSVPHMSGDEQQYIQDAFTSNWLSSVGPNLEGFEREIAERLGHDVLALGVASGSAALHLALRAAGVEAGDRVAVSSTTFIGSVYPILYLNAIPVFLDSEEVSGHMDPAVVEQYFRDAAAKNELPKALMIVHLYGQHADIDPIFALCNEYGVTMVEDAAESLGSTYKGRETATTAPLSALSFNGNKIITTTGGGMVIAKNPADYARMKKWSTQSRDQALEYVHSELGYNYRMSNVIAGIGRGQLKVLDTRVKQRQAVFARYVEALSGIPGLGFQPQGPWGTHTRWLSVIELAPDAQRTPFELIAILERDNIEARPVWRPMHTQPMLEHFPRVGGEVSERIFARGLCLPSSSRLPVEDQEFVIERIRAAFA